MMTPSRLILPANGSRMSSSRSGSIPSAQSYHGVAPLDSVTSPSLLEPTYIASRLIFKSNGEFDPEWKSHLRVDESWVHAWNEYDHNWKTGKAEEDQKEALWALIRASMKSAIQPADMINVVAPSQDQPFNYHACVTPDLRPQPPFDNPKVGMAGSQFPTYPSQTHPGTAGLATYPEHLESYATSPNAQRGFVDKIANPSMAHLGLPSPSATSPNPSFEPSHRLRQQAQHNAGARPGTWLGLDASSSSDSPTPDPKTPKKRPLKNKQKQASTEAPEWRRKNTDRDNYNAVRANGACEKCFIAKQRCNPSHIGNRDFDHSEHSKTPGPAKPRKQDAAVGAGLKKR